MDVIFIFVVLAIIITVGVYATINYNRKKKNGEIDKSKLDEDMKIW